MIICGSSNEVRGIYHTILIPIGSSPLIPVIVGKIIILTTIRCLRGSIGIVFNEIIPTYYVVNGGMKDYSPVVVTGNSIARNGVIPRAPEGNASLTVIGDRVTRNGVIPREFYGNPIPTVIGDGVVGDVITAIVPDVNAVPSVICDGIVGNDVNSREF